MPLTCPEATTKLTVLNSLKKDFLVQLEKATTGSKNPAEARIALQQAQKIKTQTEVGMRELLRDLTVEIVVSYAQNPYAEVLKEAGLPADHPECAERKEIIFNLDTVIEKQCARYTEQNLIEWATDIQNNKDILTEIVSTPEEMKIIEKRIRAGMVPIIMPGRQTQISTWEKALINLKPVWIQDGKDKTLNDPYIHTEDYVKKMTTSEDSSNLGFFRTFPDRPYLVWTKPNKTMDSATTSKTVEQQKSLYVGMILTNPDIFNPTDILPLEYAALQSTHTMEIKRLASEYGANSTKQTISPLDDNSQSYCRFLTSNKNTDDDSVLYAYFDPIKLRLHFSKGDVGVYAKRGFRPVGRS